MSRFFLFFFFFSSRRRHTRSLCDWSSDVCSSDLLQRCILAPSVKPGVLDPGLSALHRIDVHTIMFGTRASVKSNSLQRKNSIFSDFERETFSPGTCLCPVGE